MWKFIKYSFIGIFIIFGVIALMLNPSLMFLGIFLVPFAIGKIYVEKKSFTSLNEDKRQMLKNAGKTSVKAIYGAVSFTTQNLIVPLFKVLVEKLENKEELENHHQDESEKQTKEDLKDALKKRETEI